MGIVHWALTSAKLSVSRFRDDASPLVARFQGVSDQEKPPFLQNGENMDGRYDFQACIGLKVKPRKGDGLLFWSLTPNGTYDKVRGG